MLGLPCHAMVCDLQKLEACCLPTSWWTPLVCATELGRGRDCVVAISTLVPCNRVGSVNQLRVWVLWFFACSWSPATGFFKPCSLQQLAHQAQGFCRCSLRKTSHIPTASLAPNHPRRVQEPKESRQGTHECLLFKCNWDYLTKPCLSFVGLNCCSRHPDACDSLMFLTSLMPQWAFHSQLTMTKRTGSETKK